MDYTILYIIGFCILAAIIGVAVTYIMKKYKIDPKDISDGVDTTTTIITLITSTFKDMKFGNDEEIDKVVNVMTDTLEYIKTIPSEMNRNEKIYQATNYTLNLCKEFNIELNDERNRIIGTVIVLSYNLISSIENREGEA